MKRFWLSAVLGLLVPAAAWAQNPTTSFRPAGFDFGRVSTPQLGSAPRIGSFGGSTPFQSNLIDTRNTIVPVGMAGNPFVVQRTAPNAFARTLQTLFPFLVKASATAAFPEAMIIQQSLPNITIK